MMSRTAAAVAATVVVCLGSLAFAQMAPAKIADTTKGKALVDAKGMTLYTWDRDTTPGKSGCNGQCATNWPPLLVSGEAKETGSWTIVARDDGAKQWAYKGRPLYTWKNDKAPGDVDGDGKLNGAWHIAAP